MARFAIPTLVYEGEYGAVLVIKSMLEAEGIAVSFDERPPRSHVGRDWPSRLYVAREDVAHARQLIESGRL
jgi:hypothetical protein